MTAPTTGAPAYDYIVVGGGSAGAVLAARLSEEPAHRVLLLEAGPDYRSIETTPHQLLNRRRPVLDEFGWGYTADLPSRRRIPLPRGKVIGGSSSVFGTVALRGMPADFDGWERQGATGWGWQDVLPAFCQLEDDRDGAASYHGEGGPITIRRSRPDELWPYHKAFLAACREAGFPEAPDQNAPDSTGAGPLPLTVRADLRLSTALAYLAPARGRPNLTVRGDCLVDRVLFTGDRATGVQVMTDAGEESIACREVILSAGAIGTPAILLRSGIGPADQLRRLGVPLLAEHAGVGNNLIDHPAVMFQLVPRPGFFAEDLPSFQSVLRTTAPGSAELNDLQILPGMPVDLTFQTERSRRIGARFVFNCAVVLERPFSRGTLSLVSRDPRSAPRIGLGLLSDPRDLPRMVAGGKILRGLAESASLSRVIERIGMPDLPTLESEDHLAAFIWQTVTTAHHVVGTARMGAPGEAVVDPAGRVYGVANLRVADASIMPDIPRANTHLTTVMLAERIAAMMRQ